MASRGLYDELLAEGWSRVERLKAESEAESDRLDFKEVRPTATPSAEMYVKDKLAKALSGFANTNGGLLLYGLKTNGAPKGTPDQVQDIVEIHDAARFRLDIEQLCSRLVFPLVRAVSTKEILNPAKPGEGIVAVHIPASVDAHRAIGASGEVNDRYFMRTNTDLVVMPHAILADRFGRAAQPSLELHIRLSASDPMQVEIALVNTGRGAARRPAVALHDPPFAWATVGSPLKTGFRRAHTSAPNAGLVLFEPHEDVVLYPGMLRAVAWGTHSMARKQLVAPQAYAFKATLYALDMRPIEGEATLSIPAPGTPDAWIQPAVIRG